MRFDLCRKIILALVSFTVINAAVARFIEPFDKAKFAPGQRLDWNRGHVWAPWLEAFIHHTSASEEKFPESVQRVIPYLLPMIDPLCANIKQSTFVRLENENVYLDWAPDYRKNESMKSDALCLMEFIKKDEYTIQFGEISYRYDKSASDKINQMAPHLLIAAIKANQPEKAKSIIGWITNIEPLATALSYMAYHNGQRQTATISAIVSAIELNSPEMLHDLVLHAAQSCNHHLFQVLRNFISVERLTGITDTVDAETRKTFAASAKFAKALFNFGGSPQMTYQFFTNVEEQMPFSEAVADDLIIKAAQYGKPKTAIELIQLFAQKNQPWDVHHVWSQLDRVSIFKTHKSAYQVLSHILETSTISPAMVSISAFARISINKKITILSSVFVSMSESDNWMWYMNRMIDTPARAQQYVSQALSTLHEYMLPKESEYLSVLYMVVSGKFSDNENLTKQLETLVPSKDVGAWLQEVFTDEMSDDSKDSRE